MGKRHVQPDYTSTEFPHYPYQETDPGLDGQVGSCLLTRLTATFPQVSDTPRVWSILV
jgi:hypothetical protein